MKTKEVISSALNFGGFLVPVFSQTTPRDNDTGTFAKEVYRLYLIKPGGCL